MNRYRKKPAVIEAVHLTDSNAMREAAKWCGGRYNYRSEAKPSDPTDVFIDTWVSIPTLEGVMRANEGDYIIRGVHGEFYPCKPDIFEATYDQID